MSEESDSLPGGTTVSSEATPPVAGEPRALQPALTALANSGADRFDPVRFHLIDALANRARELGPAASEIVTKKALDGLRQYQADLARARGEAAEILARVRECHPDAAESASGHFARGDFRSLRRLAAGLERRGAREALSTLIELLDRRALAPAADRGAALDQLLHQQERQLLQSLDAAPPSSTEAAARPAQPGGLRAASAMATRSADRLVARAVGEMPAEAGPLNPQLLVTRSLSVMRELSPRYVRRFVPYVDTLLWLAKAGEKKG